MLSEAAFSLVLPMSAMVGVVIILLVLESYSKRHFPPGIPIMGAQPNDWFPYIQAKWRNTRDFSASMDMVREKNQHSPILVPLILAPDVVMLPPSESKLVNNQPDSVLNAFDADLDIIQGDYTFLDPKTLRSRIHESVIRKQLTPGIAQLIPGVAEETDWVLGNILGTSADDWREVSMHESICEIVAGVANRAFVGLPLCREQKLIDHGIAFSSRVPLSAIVLRLFWKPLRLLFAPLISLPGHYHTLCFRKLLASEIDRRLNEFDDPRHDNQHQFGDPSNPKPSAETKTEEDFLQWLIEHAKSQPDPALQRSAALADEVLLVNFGAIHTTAHSTSWFLANLLSSRPEYIDELREEIISVLAANGGKWNKQSVTQLEKLDSAMRESLRLNSFAALGLFRRVVAEDGLTTSNGMHLAPGTYVALPIYHMNRDSAAYKENPEDYSPFRFYHDRRDESIPPLKRARNALTATSAEYLPFGHGKHACPGRFFAAVEMKVIVAHALLHYDFQMLPVKPRDIFVGLIRLPPTNVKIRIRKRSFNVDVVGSTQI